MFGEGTGAYFSQSGSSIYSGAAGVGAFFSNNGSSIYSGAAGVDIFDASDDYGDAPEYMPDHSVSGLTGGEQMYRNAGPGPLRSFRDGSLGDDSLRAFRDGSLGRVVPTSRGPGLLRSYQDGSLGGCSSCQGTGEYFQANGVGEYFQTNGLGAVIDENGKMVEGDGRVKDFIPSAPGTPSANQADTKDTENKQLLMLGGGILAAVALYFVLKKK